MKNIINMSNNSELNNLRRILLKHIFDPGLSTLFLLLDHPTQN